MNNFILIEHSIIKKKINVLTLFACLYTWNWKRKKIKNIIPFRFHLFNLEKLTNFWMEAVFVGSVIHNSHGPIFFDDCIRSFCNDHILIVDVLQFTFFIELFAICELLPTKFTNINLISRVKICENIVCLVLIPLILTQNYIRHLDLDGIYH